MPQTILTQFESIKPKNNSNILRFLEEKSREIIRKFPDNIPENVSLECLDLYKYMLKNGHLERIIEQVDRKHPEGLAVLQIGKIVLNHFINLDYKNDIKKYEKELSKTAIKNAKELFDEIIKIYKEGIIYISSADEDTDEIDLYEDASDEEIELIENELYSKILKAFLDNDILINGVLFDEDKTSSFSVYITDNEWIPFAIDCNTPWGYNEIFEEDEVPFELSKPSLNLNQEGTILERFKKMPAKSNKNIIKFLAKENARFLYEMCNYNVSEKTSDEVFEFYLFFKENGFLEKTEKLRLDEWNSNLLMLAHGASMEFSKIAKESKEKIEMYSKTMPKNEFNNTKSLFNRIWNIRKDREIVFFYEEDCKTLKIPKTISKQGLEDNKNYIFKTLLDTFSTTAYCSIKSINKNGTYDFCVAKIENGDWTPISIDEAKEFDVFSENIEDAQYYTMTKYLN